MARTSGKQQQKNAQSRQDDESSRSGQQRMSASREQSTQQSRGQQSGGQQSRALQSAQQQSGQQQSGGQQQTALAPRSQATMPNLFVSPFISPFSFMRRFGEGMEQLFNDFGGGLMQRGMSEFADWTPQIEAFQREGQFVVRADLPGMNKDDVRVEVRDDAIVLQGERQEERREEREGMYTTERTYGRFYREIPLPEGVEAEEAMATFRDGVLEITMPSEQRETRGRQLEIQDAGEQQQQGKSRAAGAGR